jgi:phage replication-related protein YjqB (UPF0714/DUF867 family)
MALAGDAAGSLEDDDTVQPTVRGRWRARERARMTVPDARAYRGFADLAAAQVRGRDYEIDVWRRPDSPVAVIAPHGGRIEDGTSEIARAIAADDFNLYLLEGTRPSLNYRALHLTSHLFDEPECLALLAGCPFVVAIHGCDGHDRKVMLGGRDAVLKERIAAALAAENLAAAGDGHRFPAVHPGNICNRGARGQGVQLEITHPLRRSRDAVRIAIAVRGVLVQVAAFDVRAADAADACRSAALTL